MKESRLAAGRGLRQNGPVRFLSHFRPVLPVAALAALAIASSFLGRTEALPHPDLVRDIANARAFLETGALPQAGSVSSLNFYNPPGVSYGFLPGLVLFPHDPILAERASAALLFLATLAGLLAIAAPRLGHRAAALVCTCYTLSPCGVFYLTSLWPRAHPAFLIWMLFFSLRWAEKGRARDLALSLAFYAAGCFWFMEMLPAGLVFPLLWLWRRPTVKLRALLAGLAAALFLFSPYLFFEAGRDFADLRLLAGLRTRALPPPESQARIPGNRLLPAWQDPRETQAPQAFWQEVPVLGRCWVEPEPRSYLDEWGLVFCTDKLGWSFQSMETGRVLPAGAKDWQFTAPFSFRVPYAPVPHAPESAAARGLRTFAPLGFFGESLAPRLAGLVLLAASLAVLALCGGFGKPRRLLRTSEKAAETVENAAPGLLPGLTLAALLLPALAAALLLPPGGLWDGSRHFYYLSVLAALFAGCTFAALSRRFGRWAGALFAAAALAAFAANPVLFGFCRDAARGFSGENADPRAAALDAVADDMDARGLSAAHIGYDINVGSWRTSLRAVDPASKCAQEWDLALAMRRGKANLDDNPEGFSPADDYLIRQTRRAGPQEHFHERWSAAGDGSLPAMKTMCRCGDYEILRREPAQ